jgi:hypothetical protein
MLLDRDDWYDIAHDLDWSLSYVELRRLASSRAWLDWISTR